MAEIQDFANSHIADFNDAVVKGGFEGFLQRFTDDAVMRFENVPGVGLLEFSGREEYSAAYARQPPDDKIVVAGPVSQEGDTIRIPFLWKRDRTAGVMRLTTRDGRVARMVVTFT